MWQPQEAEDLLYFKRKYRNAGRPRLVLRKVKSIEFFFSNTQENCISFY